MGFLVFVATMLAISLMSTTKDSRKEARKRYKGRFYWIWYINVAVLLSFFF
jgi:hypothetical protein